MKKLNHSGFAHWILPILVIGVIGAVGAYVLSASHADSLGSSLYLNQRLYPGRQLTSPSGNYRLTLQTDGNLVVYNSNGQYTWTNWTNGKPSAYLVMQTDGNLVQYGTNGLPLWSPYTIGRGGSRLSMQDDGNIVVYNIAGKPIWSKLTGMINPAPENRSTLHVGDTLYPGHYLIAPDGGYDLEMQTDGNLVEYNEYHNPIWNTGTQGRAPDYLVMQSDGNAVLYPYAGGHALWSSRTSTFGPKTTISIGNGGGITVWNGTQGVGW